MIEKAFNQCFVNFEYMNTMGLSLAKGRFYDREYGSDITNAFVVNEALVEEMQWGDEAIGKKFIRGVNIQGADNPEGEIIGIIKNYNYGSLHNPVEPLVMACQDNASFMRTLSVRVSGQEMEEVLPWIEEKRNAFNPAYPITYSYLSDELDTLYGEEKIIFALVLWVGALSGLSVISMKSSVQGVFCQSFRSASIMIASDGFWHK